MDTILEGRAIFVAVSILALALVTILGGFYSAPADEGLAGSGEEEMAENHLLRSGFLSMVKVIAGAEDTEGARGPVKKPGYGKSWNRQQNEDDTGSAGEGQDDSEQPGSQNEDDTYGKDDGKSPGSKAGSRYILGFYVDDEYIHPSSYDRMITYGKSISAVAPFWYRLSPTDGSKLQEHHPEDGFTAQEMKRIIAKAHDQDMEVLMLIHNLLYGGKANGKELAKKMLASKESRKVFIDNVENIVDQFNYDGINIDIESIYVSDRDRFSALIKELYGRLSPKGYKITVCVPAKTTDNLKNTWSGPFDYKEIARYSDYVAIMTYDEHGYSSGPGPVASYNWVRKVMKYAVGQMPAHKILMGIPGYGFDWTVGKKGARYISYAQATSIASSSGASIKWDDTARVPYFKYRENGQSHEVWFESKYSLEHKLDIVEEYNIGGIALWRLGLEDAEVWDVIEKRITAIK
ncbi:MAG: glycosyl hydrolase family 18 protein [Clostridia bacterium]|jgi:spore germination protein YaaH